MTTKQKPEIVFVDAHAVCQECKRQRPLHLPDALSWRHKTCSLPPKEAVVA